MQDGLNGGIFALSFEIIAPEQMFGLVTSGLDLPGALFKCNPGQVTSGEMVSLGTGFTALTFGASHELLEFAVQLLDVQLLDVPSHGVFFFHVVSAQPR